MNFKREIFLITFFVLTFSLFSQNKNNFSVTFTKDSISSVILKIKKITKKEVFFDNDWLESDKVLNRNFKDQSLNKILDEIFINYFELNYILFDDKIIITNNKNIVTNFSKTLFRNNTENNKDTVIQENNIPIYKKEFIEKETDLIVLGKENSHKKKYYLLKGNIKSILSNKPIIGVKIGLKNENYATHTDKFGNYILKVPYGYHILEAKKSNYKKTITKILVYGDSTLQLNMFDSSEDLNVVVVTGKIRNFVTQSALGVTAIKGITAKIVPMVLGERDLLKIATTMPGVKTAGEGSLGYNVRGGKVDQNLILLDNATIYNPSHFFGIFSAINPFSTKSATIYKGSLPAEYGGRLSSVIDIKTKEISKDKFKGEGNLGIVTSNLMLEIPIQKDKTAVLAGYRTTYSNWVLKTLDSDFFKKSEASFLDGIVRVESKVNKNNSVHATVYYSKDKYSISSDSLYQYQNQLASFEWIHKFNNNNKLSLQFNNSIYDFNIINDGNLSSNFDIHFAIKENQIKLKLDKKLNKHHFNYGISAKLYNLKPGDIKPLGSQSIINYKHLPKEKGVESGLFLSDKYKITNKLLVDLGFRYSYYAFLGESNQNIYIDNSPHIEENILETKHFNKNEIVKNYRAPEIRISARYAFTNDFSFKMSVNNSTQFLHLLSSNTTASPIDTWKLSNLNIKPQKSMQYSTGLYKNFNNKMYEVNIEGYYKTIKNILEYKIGSELLLNDNIENEILDASGKAYGVELLIKKNTGKFNGWLGYSYSRSFIKANNLLLSNQINNGNYYPANYDKPHDFSLIMNYKLTKRYSFSFNFIYQTGRPITYPIGNYQYAGSEHVLYSDRNQFRLPDYYRLDLGVNLEGNHKIKKLAHSFWNISVYNVLGRNNPYSLFFVNEEGTIQAYQLSIFAMPIPTISYNFKF